MVFEEERKWVERHLPALKINYGLNTYFIVHNGQVVDFDADDVVLEKRFYEKFGEDTPHLLTTVQQFLDLKERKVSHRLL